MRILDISTVVAGPFASTLLADLDVCAVVYVAEPELFGLVPARVEVETAGRLTSGMTVTDFSAADRNEDRAADRNEDRNALVAMEIDAERFWELTLKTYANLAAAMTR